MQMVWDHGLGWLSIQSLYSGLVGFIPDGQGNDGCNGDEKGQRGG